jgi:hypothetical protein
MHSDPTPTAAPRDLFAPIGSAGGHPLAGSPADRDLAAAAGAVQAAAWLCTRVIARYADDPRCGGPELTARLRAFLRAAEDVLAAAPPPAILDGPLNPDVLAVTILAAVEQLLAGGGPDDDDDDY